jgi:hypothetical protein
MDMLGMVCFLARNARKGNTTQRSQRRNELSAADPQIFKSPQDFPFAPLRLRGKLKKLCRRCTQIFRGNKSTQGFPFVPLFYLIRNLLCAFVPMCLGGSKKPSV